MDDSIAYKKIYNTIISGDRFALVLHRKPDGDTIGSAVAFGIFLEKLGKKFQFFCVDEVAPSYRNLLRSVGIFDLEINKTDQIVGYKPNFVILFDCADWKQASLVNENDRKQFPFFINIDHHVSNKGLCDLNLIISEASSTCEIVYNFLKNNKISITQKIAASLFMGIVTDTGNFSNPATTNSSLSIAAHLLLCGARHKDTHDSFFRNQNIEMLRLWGIALKRLKYSEDKMIASTFLKLDDFKDCNVCGNSAEGLSNFLQSSLRADAIIVYCELEDGLVKASIRSDGKFDASEYAKKFGGGGHKKASGFTTEGMVKEGRDRWEVVDLDFLRKT